MPHLGACASSGRDWRLLAARHTQGERPGHQVLSHCLRCSSQPPPKSADSPAFAYAGAAGEDVQGAHHPRLRRLLRHRAAAGGAAHPSAYTCMSRTDWHARCAHSGTRVAHIVALWAYLLWTTCSSSVARWYGYYCTHPGRAAHPQPRAAPELRVLSHSHVLYRHRLRQGWG
eukprot:scaffold59841_cov57-Phaeocystis_antarctica.AAC.2